MKRRFAPVLTLLAACTLCAASAARITSARQATQPTSAASKEVQVHELKKAKCRFRAPTYWGDIVGGAGDYAVEIDVKGQADESPCMFMLRCGDKLTGNNLSDEEKRRVFVATVRKHAVKDDPEAKLTETRLGGSGATIVLWRTTVTDQKLRAIHADVCCVRRGVVYQLTFIAPPSRYDEIKGEFQDLVRSFEFTD